MVAPSQRQGRRRLIALSSVNGALLAAGIQRQAGRGQRLESGREVIGVKREGSRRLSCVMFFGVADRSLRQRKGGKAASTLFLEAFCPRNRSRGQAACLLAEFRAALLFEPKQSFSFCALWSASSVEMLRCRQRRSARLTRDVWSMSTLRTERLPISRPPGATQSSTLWRALHQGLSVTLILHADQPQRVLPVSVTTRSCGGSCGLPQPHTY